MPNMYAPRAVWMAAGLGVLLLPHALGARLLPAGAAPAAAFFLTWLLVSYLATALKLGLPIPALAQAIGVYVWPSEAMSKLGLQLAVAAALGGLARSRLPPHVRCAADDQSATIHLYGCILNLGCSEGMCCCRGSAEWRLVWTSTQYPVSCILSHQPWIRYPEISLLQPSTAQDQGSGRAHC